MLVPNERTHQVCTSILYIYLFASYFHNLLSVSLILYIFSELALQTTSTFLLVILARRSLMLPYLHASLRILLARESNIAGQFFFFDWWIFWLKCKFWKCRDARVMWDQKTGRSRGFGFVSFRNQQVCKCFCCLPLFFLFINEN